MSADTLERTQELARELFPPAAYHDAASLAIEAGDLRTLCRVILSDDLKREIENAAYERAIKCAANRCGGGDDRFAIGYDKACAEIETAIRALINPPPDKENGK